MFPNQFEYHRPNSVQAAAGLLAADPEAKLLAGGHSLLPAMKLRLASPSSLVDLGGVSGLDSIDTSGPVTFGAMTTYAAIRDSREVKNALPILAEAADNVGDPAVQARGTIGGALAHSDPAADFTAIFLALDGSVDVTGTNGTRTIAADDLFVDLFTTALEADEIITSVSFPAADGAGMAYEKFRHPASGYAVVGVAVKVSKGADGNVESARIAVTGAPSKATRATAAEQALVGKALEDAAIDAAAAVAADGMEINGDHFASEEYRRHLIGVLTGRALRQAAGQ
ncbi:MAG: molybdopterin dehydrogenase FAD-binding protein [Thermomicrobiales bacterium]|nr:molybdopterin dehydrogenase FAD-binding protein [Thermomicrobiales bacterium]MDF3038490.1 molybdopterin dehydrogenase FAD-binding protein [Thermomicrobiales bacterium]